MAKSDDVQDERYVAVPWMAKSDDVQDERYVAVPWMAKRRCHFFRKTFFFSYAN
ncbi:MAG: hypothetical protein HRT37_04145 [Alteromonadaceae bacterium]|nr:hypothetical protein [Alteromonadaceae bacterium]